MPYVSDVYYDLLLNALTNGQYGPVELTEEAMNAALQRVETQIQAMSPDPNDLDGSLERFASRQPHPEIYRRLRPDSDTIGRDNESRFDYAQRCRRELMKTVKWRVQQELEWRNATSQLGLYDEMPDPNGGTKKELKHINTNRFLDRLMRTGGTAEDRHFNEAVVALAALANGDITKEKYLELRCKHHIAAGEAKEDAEYQAKRDLENGGEFLYNAVEKEIREGSEKLFRYNSAVAAIHSGDYSGFNGGMEEVFDTFRNNAVELEMVGLEIFATLNKLGLKHPTEEEQKEKRGRWLDDAFNVLQMKETAEQVANPYFAILDPFKYYRVANNESGRFLPLEKDRKPQDALAYELFAAGSTYQVTAGRTLLRRGLKRCAIGEDNEVTSERLPGFSIFHKGDRTLIFKIGHADYNGVISAEIDTSGELIRQGMPEEAQSLLNYCGRWSTEKRTSRQFEDMREALEAVAHLNFSEKPTEAELSLAGEKFSDLLWTTQAYMDRKLGQHPDENWSGSYESARVEFAKRVMKFTRTKLRQLDYLAEQKATIAMRDKAEAEMPNELDPQRRAPKYAGMSALEYKLALEKEREAAAEAQRRQERAEKNKDISNRFGTLAQGLAAASKDTAAAAAKLKNTIDGAEIFVSMSKRSLDQGRTPTGAPAKQADRDALLGKVRQAIALRAVAELVNEEQQRQAQNPGKAVKAPISQIVNAGKAEQLAALISDSEPFEKLFGSQIHYYKITELVRSAQTDALREKCVQAGRDFLTGIMMAKVEQERREKEKEKAVEQVVQEDEKKNDEKKDEKKEDEKKKDEKEKEQPAAQEENQNHINIIGEDDEDEIEQRFKESLKEILGEAREVKSRDGVAAEKVKRLAIMSHSKCRGALETDPKDDRFGLRKKSAKEALAASVLQYMLGHEGAGGVLANAVEKGQMLDLQDAIGQSEVFAENFRDFDWEKTGVDWAAENRFCTQVGDGLLRAAKPVLKEEAPLVARQKAAEKGTAADADYFEDRLDNVFRYVINKAEEQPWATEAAQKGEDHPAAKYVDERIQSDLEAYEQGGAEAGAHLKTAFAGMILSRMMEDEGAQSVLETAVERGTYDSLMRTICRSPLFEDAFASLDPADEEKATKYIENAEDYIYPLGDRILKVSRGTIRDGAEKVEKAKRDARFDSLEKESCTLYLSAYDEAEKAKKAEKPVPEQVVERTREAVALYAVYGILSLDTDDVQKHQSNEQLKKLVYDSREFNERLAQYDLHDPANIKEVSTWRPGHGLPMGFDIGMKIADRLKTERKNAVEQKEKNAAQKQGNAKENQQGGKVI